MERAAVFFLFLIFNLAGLGPISTPPEPGVRPEVKVTSVQTTVKEIKFQARTILLAGAETVDEDRSRQG